MIWQNKLPDLQPVASGGNTEGFFEDPMEVTHVFIPYGTGDPVYGAVRRFQQKGGLRQPLFLDQLGVGFAGPPLDLPGKTVKIIVLL